MTRVNAFAGDDAYGLSEVAQHFIAGQLHHAAGISAVLAPLVNSYKRLVRGFEAPIFISWARTNRGALIRVPHVGRAEATRVELRSPDPSCNPYLAFAVMLRCGLDGIERRLPLPPPVEESLYGFDEVELERRNVGVLPDNLKDAIDALEADEVVIDALGRSPRGAVHRRQAPRMAGVPRPGHARGRSISTSSAADRMLAP